MSWRGQHQALQEALVLGITEREVAAVVFRMSRRLQDDEVEAVGPFDAGCRRVSDSSFLSPIIPAAQLMSESCILGCRTRKTEPEGNLLQVLRQIPLEEFFIL